MSQAWDIKVVCAMFPQASQANIGKYFSALDSALNQQIANHKIADESSITKLKLYAYATIRVENARFDPRDERVSRFNTAFHRERPEGAGANINNLYDISEHLISSFHLDRPFALYDDSVRGNHTLGNTKDGMGQTYRGRGFIQITGRHNYVHYSHLAHAPEIVSHPDKAHDPQVAARILVAYIVANRKAILAALDKRDFVAARRVVNGHRALGHKVMEHAYRQGEDALHKSHGSGHAPMKLP